MECTRAGGEITCDAGKLQREAHDFCWSENKWPPALERDSWARPHTTEQHARFGDTVAPFFLRLREQRGNIIICPPT